MNDRVKVAMSLAAFMGGYGLFVFSMEHEGKPRVTSVVLSDGAPALLVECKSTAPCLVALGEACPHGYLDVAPESALERVNREWQHLVRCLPPHRRMAAP